MTGLFVCAGACNMGYERLAVAIVSLAVVAWLVWSAPYLRDHHITIFTRDNEQER